MKKIIRQILLLYFTLLICSSSYAQTGPGGVGNSTSNIVWLVGDSLASLSDGDNITTWPDGSGNANDLSQPNAIFTPVYKVNILNGKPVVRFNKDNGRIRRTSFADFPTTQITTFIVNKNAENGDGMFSYASTAHNNDFLLYNSPNLRVYRAANFNSTGLAINNDSWNIIDVTWRNSDGAVAVWLNGAVSYTGTLATGTSITQNGCLAIAGEQDAVDGGYDAGQAHFGDFAEIIVYNLSLNSAQRIIVTNYLAAKFNLDISASGNDYFSFEATHSYGLAGIGREDASNNHTTAMSSNILQISNPGALDADKEYLLFGHDTCNISGWTTTEAPNSGVNIQRLAREWRLDETGELGTLTFTIDTSLFPSRPAGYTKFVLLVDADGDFSTGASVYEMSSPGSDEFFEVGNINISSGDYIAVGTVIPTVEFDTDTQSDFETNNANLTIQLNYISLVNVDVDYYTTDGTAIAPGDYTAVPATTATIIAGTTSTPVTITVNNDTDVEDDESFTVTLTNQPAGIVLGGNSTLTYTLHDDDNTRKVHFSIATSSGDEGTTPAQVTVAVTPFDPVNTTTVDYKVTGGTATGGGTDYILASGTVIIPPLTVSNTFDITIVDDGLSEADETIEITLYNPTNSNLSDTDPIDHTFTINDNDVLPTVQFDAASSVGSESASLASISVILSAVAGQDVSVNYTVAGTATSGVDHDLVDGSIIIPSGSLSNTIDFNITDDTEQESDETVQITLGPPVVNATLGAQTVHTYAILDNDGEFGFSGPGGVGDKISNLVWLEADSITGLSDGDDLPLWTDGSGNSLDFSQPNMLYQPVYRTNLLNGKPIIRFQDFNNDRIRRTGFASFPSTAITTFFVNKNMDGGDGLLSYASTGSDNDFLLYNSTNIGIYRGTNVNSGINISDDSWHIVDVSWRSVDGATSLWLDGSDSYSTTHQTGTLITPNGCLAIGGEQDAIDGGYAAGQAHAGDFAEVIVYNVSLNDAQRIIVANYLASKYDLSLSANDYFAFELTHNNDVAGIGRVDNANT
ncbi:MAG: hypothetical protein KAU83_03070, partial [Bacteroidales bacterium]|nr:hypothetical protein [Bacteroidales bacterium]